MTLFFNKLKNFIKKIVLASRAIPILKESPPSGHPSILSTLRANFYLMLTQLQASYIKWKMKTEPALLVADREDRSRSDISQHQVQQHIDMLCRNQSIKHFTLYHDSSFFYKPCNKKTGRL